MSRVMVTGAGGFVAAPLLFRLVAEGHDVVAVVRPGGSRPPGADPAVAIVACDMGDPAAVQTLVTTHRPATVVDLAVVRGDDLARARRVNVEGFTALLEVAGEIGAHLVHAGSSTEFGPHDTPMGADTVCRPTIPLGITKLEATRRLAAAVDAGRIDACTLRIFHVYGPHEPASRLVPSAVEAAVTGAPLPLTPPGLAHDLIHVDDVVDALLAAMTQRLVRAEPISVCTGVSTSNETVVDLIEEAAGRPVDRRVGDFPVRSIDRGVWTGDPSELVALLGRPPRTLRDGLAALVTDRLTEVAS